MHSLLMKSLAYGIAALMLVAAGQAAALEKETFTQERFKELRAQGHVILVDVFAEWCPTCARQQDAIEAYRQANPNKKFKVLEVDFDKDKANVIALRAPRQSTLILYRGEQQFWYSVAETRPDVIAAELDKAFTSR